MRRISLLILFFSVWQANAQLRHCIDSIKYDLKQERAWFLSLDGKNSIISDLNFKLFGLQYGYLYNKRTNLYVGFYSSYRNEKRIIDNPTATGNPATDSNTVYKQYAITYFNFGCEYYFHNSKRWRFSIPVALGIGMGKSKTERNLKPVSQKSSTVLPLEFGVTANYKIKWWIWLGAGLGNRITIGDGAYSGPYFTMGLSLRFGEMYNRVSKWYKENY